MSPAHVTLVEFEAWRKDRDPIHLKALGAFLGSGEPDVRSSAMYALGLAERGVTNAAIPVLLERLEDPESAQAALHVLDDLARPDLASQIESALARASQPVRRTGLRALGKMMRPQQEFWTRETSVAGRAPSLTAIIHGTWAEDETWWRWPAEFPQHLDGLTEDVYRGEDAFQWSGDNTHDAREKAARDLIRWLKEHPADRTVLVAHSHGGNVVFKATQLAEAGEIQIRLLVLLGTPIRDDYAPDLEKIGHVLNVYDEDDVVQWFGAFGHWRDGGRRLPEGGQVRNLQVHAQGDSPHSELHTPPLWTREGVDAAVGELLG